MEERHQGARFENERDLNRLFGFDIVDRNGESVGKVENIWMDETNQPAFFGTQSGWLSGKLHVVPAHGSEVTFQKQRIRLPFSKERVKDAPSHDPSSDLTGSEEEEIYRYYNLTRPQISAQPEAVETAEGTAEAIEAERDVERPADEKEGLRLHEERVDVGKRQVESGGVRLRKVIRTETVNRPVELEHEDIEIERVPASEQERVQAGELGEDEIYIPLRREEPVVQKEVHPTEEIRLRKKTETERRDIEGTERREELEIERDDEERRYGT